MTIDKQTAKDLIEEKVTDTDFVKHDDILKGIGEDGGLERYCIIRDITNERLYRFIYEQKDNENNVYYRDAQLMPVKQVDVVQPQYQEIDNVQVHIKYVDPPANP